LSYGFVSTIVARINLHIIQIAYGDMVNGNIHNLYLSRINEMGEPNSATFGCPDVSLGII